MISLLIYSMLSVVGVYIIQWAVRLAVAKLTPTGPDSGRASLLDLNPFLVEIVTSRMSTGRPVGHVLVE